MDYDDFVEWWLEENGYSDADYDYEAPDEDQPWWGAWGDYIDGKLDSDEAQADMRAEEDWMRTKEMLANPRNFI